MCGEEERKGEEMTTRDRVKVCALLSCKNITNPNLTDLIREQSPDRYIDARYGYGLLGRGSNSPIAYITTHMTSTNNLHANFNTRTYSSK